MDFGEIVGELVFEIIIPRLIMAPGALIRWVFAKITGSKKKYRDYYKSGGFLTGLFGVLFYVLLILCIIYL